MLRNFIWLHLANVAARFDVEILLIDPLQVLINLAGKNAFTTEMFSSKVKATKTCKQVSESKFCASIHLATKPSVVMQRAQVSRCEATPTHTRFHLVSREASCHRHSRLKADEHDQADPRFKFALRFPQELRYIRNNFFDFLWFVW
jgi:hypothetical protein